MTQQEMNKCYALLRVAFVAGVISGILAFVVTIVLIK